jgi:hypothetical protein
MIKNDQKSIIRPKVLSSRFQSSMFGLGFSSWVEVPLVGFKGGLDFNLLGFILTVFHAWFLLTSLGHFRVSSFYLCDFYIKLAHLYICG